MPDLVVSGKVGPGGRIVIPAAIRRELGLEPGDPVTFRLEGGDLRLVSREAALKRIQDRFRASVPRDVSLVDELIADRRREVAGE